MDTTSELRTMPEKIDIEVSRNEDRSKSQDTRLKVQGIKFAFLQGAQPSHKPPLHSLISAKIDIEQSRNEDHNKVHFFALNARLKNAYLSGGEKRIADHKVNGKMTAHEAPPPCSAMA